MKNDNRIEGRIKPDKVEWVKKKLADKFQGSDTALIDWMINTSMQQEGTPADITTSDGQHMIRDGQLYELQSFRPGGPGAWVKFDPSKLRQRAQGDTWKRELAERKDARETESHQAEMLIKKVQVLKLQKRYAPETVPQRCKVPGCTMAGIVFTNMAALNSHLSEYHPDRYPGGNHGVTYSQGTWYQGGQPALRWDGARE